MSNSLGSRHDGRIAGVTIGDFGRHRATVDGAEKPEHNTVNANPRFFGWTKSADDILVTINRVCLHTLETAQRQHELIKTQKQDTI